MGVGIDMVKLFGALLVVQGTSPLRLAVVAAAFVIVV